VGSGVYQLLRNNVEKGFRSILKNIVRNILRNICEEYVSGTLLKNILETS
jgi:hypothetical protein